MKPTLSVIMVNWNTKDLLRNCLKSLDKYLLLDDISYEIIVADNASSDGSQEMVKREFPHVRLIENRENLGFVKANNQAAKIARGKYLMLLNSDTEMIGTGAKEIIEFMEKNPRVAIVGGKIYNPDMTIQRSCRRFPSLWRLYAENTFRLIKHIPTPFYNRYIMKNFDYNSIGKVDWVTGAYMYVKKELVDKYGLFDENIFMFYEDTLLCYKFKKLGYDIYFYPSAPIIHYHGESRKKVQVRSIISAFESSVYYASQVYSLKVAKIYETFVILSWKFFYYYFKIFSFLFTWTKFKKKRDQFCNMLKLLCR